MTDHPASDFYFDVMIDKQDYCNRKEEIKKLSKSVENGRISIIYAPRRYGKSSLVKNIVGHHFNKKPNQICIYINLMEVQTLENISERILDSLKEVVREKFPIKSNLKSILESLKGLTFSFSLDPISQIPSIEVKPLLESDKKSISNIFSNIRILSKKYKIFLIFDEFQDISLIPQASGLLRAELQSLKNTPIAILGSKKHLLNKMFSKHNSPFFNFGDEMVLSAIQPSQWISYFNIRLAPHTISEQAMSYLCHEVSNVPNAISELGFYLKEDSKNLGKKKTEFQIKDIQLILQKIYSNKESIYRFQEGLLTVKEQALLRVIAQRKYILKPTEQSIVQAAKISSGSIIKIITRLANKGWIEFEDHLGYRISDPLFSSFLNYKYNGQN